MIENIQTEVGVGPHPLPWPKGKKYDRELLENGDRRNVSDKYRYFSNEAIKSDLDKDRIQLQIAIENWQNDFNIGTIIRTANAFNVSKVHIIGRRHYNRRGAMVTDKYMNIEFHKAIDDFVSQMKSEDRAIVAVDIVPGAKLLSKTKLPTNSVFVFGGEGPGLSKEMQAASQETVMIEQFGSTRSINLGVAAGILMYAWLQQNVFKNIK